MDRFPKLKLKSFANVSKQSKQIKIDAKEAMLQALLNLFSNMTIHFLKAHLGRDKGSAVEELSSPLV